MAFRKHFEDQADFLERNPDLATQQVMPAVRGAPSYDASADVAALDKAIKGVDEKTITKILTKANNAQRQVIKETYKTTVGKPLDEALKKVTSGNYGEVCLNMLKTPAEYDAEELKNAMTGLKTDQDTLTEILASRTPDQIKAIKAAYKEMYKNDLAKDITSDTSGTSGHFKKTLLALVEASRSTDANVNDELVDSDTRAFYAAGGEQKKEIDVQLFIDIMTTRSYPHLRIVFNAYRLYSREGIQRALDMELKEDFEKLLTAVVKCAAYTPAFFAERLHLAMKDPGKKDRILIRNILSRLEIDMRQIRDVYKRIFAKDLHVDILEECKGDYQTILLELVGGA